MLKPVVYPSNLKAEVGKRVRHKATGYWFEKSKNGKWGLVFTDDLTEQIRVCYVEDGMPLRDIAKMMGVTHSVIQKLVDSHGWMRSKRDRGVVIKKVLSKHNTLKRMYIKDKMSAGEIAEHFGIDASYFEKYFKEQPYYRTMSESTKLAISKGTFVPPGVDKHLTAWDYWMSVDIRTLDSTQYKYAVRSFTNCVLIRYGHLIDPKGKRSKAFHIDHRLSIADAFTKLSKNTGRPVPRKEPIPLYVVCHPANLKLMPGKDNHAKSARSSITVKSLHKAIAEFETQHGVVF